MSKTKVQGEVVPRGVDGVLDLVVSGKPLREALKGAGVKPSEWVHALQNDPKLMERYGQVKLLYSDLMATEMLGIADDLSIDPVRANNMIKARMWLASKWNSKQYGDKLDVQVTKTVDIGAALADARSRVEAIEVKAKVVERVEGVDDGDVDQGKSV